MNSTDIVVVNYFGINAKAGLIRCILDTAGVNFTDNKHTQETWQKEKALNRFEFSQMPALEINGNIYTQTIAIEIYLARKLGFLGVTTEDEYEILSLLNSREDIEVYLYPIIILNTDERKAKLEENLKALFSTHLPKTLSAFEKRLTQRTGKYLVGDKISLGDMFLAYFCQIYFRNPGRVDQFVPILKQYAPTLSTFTEGLVQNELKTYYTKSYNHESIF